MTKKSVRGEFNSFVKGLITEASPLNFPEGACKDINNFVLNKDGTLNRRLGFDVKQDVFQTIANAAVSIDNVSTYVWEEPAGQVGVTFLAVYAAGGDIHFFDISTDAWTYIGSFALFSLGERSRSSFTSIDGKLLVPRTLNIMGNILTSVIAITFNPSTSTFSSTGSTLFVRDIWGINTNNTPYTRPTSDDPFHRYNLYNNGWATERGTSASVFTDPATNLFTNEGFYPAEIDTVWSGIVTEPISGTPYELWKSKVFKQAIGSTGSASRGSFIIDFFNRGESRASQIAASQAQNPSQPVLVTSGFPLDRIETWSPVLTQHAGRVFYAGFGPTVGGDARSPDSPTHILFSRLVSSISDTGKCYQEGDPTSRDAPDVVDTDGGVIKLSGVSGINHMLSLGRNLLVFAANGVWDIEGGSDFGFTATNYKVSKISDFGCISGDSVVSDGSTAYYWGSSGIFRISRNEFGDLVVASISDSTVAKFYSDIPSTAKLRAQGAYDLVEKKIRWVYPNGTWDDFPSGTTELVLDTVLGAFYKNEIPSYDRNKVSGIFFSELTGRVEYFIVRKPLVGSMSASIGIYKDASFLDWVTLSGTGVDAKAYLETGAITASDSAVHKQVPVLVVHMQRTETSLSESFELQPASGCLARVSWDFASSSITKKQGPLFQVYRIRRPVFPAVPGDYDNGFELVTTRNKLRGRGRALSLYMESEAGKDCKIVGWSLSMNGNSVA